MAWNENYDLNISLNEFESDAYGGPRDLPRMNWWIDVTRDMSGSRHQKTARRTGSPVRLIGIRKKGGTIVCRYLPAHNILYQDLVGIPSYVIS